MRSSCLNKKETIENLKIKNCFVHETVLFRAKVDFDKHIMFENEFFEEFLWHSSVVRIDNCPNFQKEWFD